jgi:hypothetical protein
VEVWVVKQRGGTREVLVVPSLRSGQRPVRLRGVAKGALKERVGAVLDDLARGKLPASGPS